MAYEEQKNSIAQIITNAVDISRVRDAALEKFATDRALEARQQVGLYVHIGNPDADKIIHPPAPVRQARLGVPSSVGTAELAIWTYLINPPVYDNLAMGLLNSPDHRAVLDNPIYTHWGLGIYTEFPDGEEGDERFRRWYHIIELATEHIGGAAVATPSQKLVKKVSFAAGIHYGYRFGFDGRILETKRLTLNAPSRANTSGRGKIPGMAGDWLLMGNGALAGFWVLEDGFFALPHPRL